MNTLHGRTLIRESQWMRIFKLSDGKTIVYESKFLLDDLRIRSAQIESIWKELLLDQQVEFASAFSCQPPRDENDRRILDFLMEVGSEEVCRTIARLLPFLEDRDRAIRFLIAKAEQVEERRANYYQSLERLGGETAIPLLRKHHEQYGKLLDRKSAKGRDSDVWLDYLQCSKALWTLTRDRKYLAVLQDAEKNAPTELLPIAGKLRREVD
jgi:hypothetical protein